MTSLCQNVSTSYECHVYENKTLKKIIHKRNGSQVSDKNSVKSSKLSLVSKDKQQIKTISTEKANQVTLGKKSSNNLKQKKNKHARCWSNHEYPDKKPSTYANFQVPTISPNQFSLHERGMGPLYQMKREAIRPTVYFNKLLQQSLPDQKSNFQSLNKTLCTNSGQSVKINGILCSQRTRPYMHTKRQEVLKTSPMVQRQIQSRKQEIDFSSNKKHTRANSLTTNFSPQKENLQKMESSTVEDLIHMQTETVEYDFNQLWTPRKNSLNENFQYKKMVESLESQNSHAGQNSPLQLDFHSRSEHKLAQKRQCFQFQPNTSFWRPLRIQDPQIVDAQSTFSQNFYQDENEQQSKSIVEQRNFFFQKQQLQPRSLKKSLSNLKFHQPGYFSPSRKWTLFRHVEEKDTRKAYSVKSFYSQSQKQYINEYEIYMTLKTESFQLVTTQSRSNNIFLNLFSVLANNQQGNLYLVKENFDYLLDEYIAHIKKSSECMENYRQFLQVEKAIIINQISQVVRAFSSKGIELARNQQLKTEDFVVCKNQNNGEVVVKLHSLYKFQKVNGLNSNSSFLKLRRLKNSSRLTNQYYDLKQNTIKSNLGPIQKSIFEAFFP